MRGQHTSDINEEEISFTDTMECAVDIPSGECFVKHSHVFVIILFLFSCILDLLDAPFWTNVYCTNSIYKHTVVYDIRIKNNTTFINLQKEIIQMMYRLYRACIFNRLC